MAIQHHPILSATSKSSADMPPIWCCDIPAYSFADWTSKFTIYNALGERAQANTP